MLATETSVRQFWRQQMFFTHLNPKYTITTTETETTLHARKSGVKLSELFGRPIPKPQTAGEYEAIISEEMAAVYDEKTRWVERPWKPQVW